MRVVLTRVSSASVTVDGEVIAELPRPGLLALLGVGHDDTAADGAALARKIWGLRILEGELSASDVDAPVLVVSQFTLYASYKKGNRPSWFRAARHEISVPLYEEFCRKLSDALGRQVGTGEFGADMKVELLNDGPVTICMDTKNKE